MRTFRLWDKTEELVLIDGRRRSPQEIFEEVPNVKNSAQIMLEIMPNGTVGGIDDLALMCGIYQIEEGLTPEQALEKVAAAINTPPQAPVDKVEAKLDYLIMVTE
ncbi:hypothetical protein [Acidaminobacterium chupaoyuni]|mgnify:CR=1 FL=1